MSTKLTLRLIAAALAAAIAAPAAPAQADPPDWAPAHGWRDKHGHKHHRHDDERVVYVPYPVMPAYAYPQRRVRAPYGLDRGTCDRGLLSAETVGNVLGGVAGGVAGNQFGKGQGKTAATIGGTILGVIVGGSVGETMDRVDSACVAQALEYAPDNRRIAWANERSGAGYNVVPVRSWQSGGAYCREYQTLAAIGGRRETVYGTACRMPDGSWQIQP